MLWIATDTKLNGTRKLIRDPSPRLRFHTGRGIGVVSRTHAEEGYMDLDLDDFQKGSLYAEWQEIVLDTAEILVVSTCSS
jgi:hypothetical protein